MKGFNMLDVVVGRQYKQQAVGVERKTGNGRNGYSRSRVPPGWLQDDGLRLDVDRPQLLGDKESMILVADDNGLTHTLNAGQAKHRILEHSVVVDQR